MSTDQEALKAIFDKALGTQRRTSRKPTAAQVDSALSVLGWLSEQDNTDGETRDEISRIRDLLWNL